MNSVHSRKGHLMETMIERMEQYNKNLENIVEDRTKDYLEEKRKVRTFRRVLRDSTPRYVGLSVGQSVGRSVCPTLLFFAFLSSLKVDKCRFRYFMSGKQQFCSFFHIRISISQTCWSVGPSVCLSHFAFLAFFRLFKGRGAHI